MRRVTGEATLVGLHRRVLKDEGSHGVGVALGADCKLTRRRPHLMAGLRAVGIVTVTALDETNIDAVAIGPRELRLLLRVAAIAQLGLRLDQHKVDVSRFMRAVTTGATNAVSQVFRFRKILGLKAGLMTLRTDCRGLGRAECLEPDDLGDVASAINVRLARTVTGLASVLVTMQQRGMWRTGEVFIPHFLVAGLANFSFRVRAVGRSGEGLRGLDRLIRRLLTLAL